MLLCRAAVVPNIVRLPGPIVIKLFTAVIYEWANKLGCLSLQALPSLIFVSKDRAIRVKRTSGAPL